MVTLCTLYNIKHQRVNVYRMVKDYFTFAYNVTKRCINVLHSMGFYVSYETIQVAFKENTKEIKIKIQNIVWYNRLLLSFNNMNFYEYTQDYCLYNKKHKLNYITGYICLIDTDIDIQRIYINAKSLDKGAKVVFSN